MSRFPALALNRGCSIMERSPNEVRVAGPLGLAILRCMPAGMFAALRRLAVGHAFEEVLVDHVQRVDGHGAVMPFQVQLERLKRCGLLAYMLVADDVPFLTVQPTSRQFRFEIQPVGDPVLVLSRFAYMHRVGVDVVLESPLAFCSVVCHDHRVIALLHALRRPKAAHDLVHAALDLPADVLRVALGVFRTAGFASPVAADGTPAEDSVALRQWEFHDLLFHARSRLGRHADPVGATFRFLGTIPPIPAVAERSVAEVVPLHRPDLLTSPADHRSFSEVLEARMSTRAHGSPPITARQLGDFLYRVARVRHIFAADPQRGLFDQTTSQPYPGGGAVHELELYLAVAECTDIVPGLYRYNPLDHNLGRLDGLTPHVTALLQDAQHSTGMVDTPQVLIIVAARFQRVGWKYSSIAYALILKDVGVLYQTMYLVATALGLAACALGAGDSDLFARAAETEYARESSVGEFLLGSLPTPDSGEEPADEG